MWHVCGTLPSALGPSLFAVPGAVVGRSVFTGCMAFPWWVPVGLGLGLLVALGRLGSRKSRPGGRDRRELDRRQKRRHALAIGAAFAADCLLAAGGLVVYYVTGDGRLAVGVTIVALAVLSVALFFTGVAQGFRQLTGRDKR